MCGICGLFTTSLASETSSILAQMNQALLHRGPDEAGHYSQHPCHMAMRRLAIIDLAGGHQPISNEDGKISTVFNGEIYNFHELRQTLRDRGHHFQTQSDTEVIVHLYEDEAENTAKLLKGMFAFAIHDQRDDSLFIARDRFGEKPLYYYCHPQDGFVFSSEIKSLLVCPFVPRELDYEALGYYMRAGAVPAPLTMFKDIRVLPPGHWLRLRDGTLEIQPFYTIDYTPDPALEDEATAVDAVQTLLRQAVERQAISDVPLGALLSGGIDSSAIVAMLQSVSTQRVKTFTARFEDSQYDEGAIAQEVATYFDTEHHEIVVPNVAFEPDDLWRIVDHVGLPFFDLSAIPTYLLCKQIRQEVTVALAGDGGDELFAGYPWFQWGQTIRRVQTLPSALIRAGAQSAGWLSQQPLFGNVSGLRRLRRGLQGATDPRYLLPITIDSVFEPTELATLLRNKCVLATATGALPLLTDLPPEAQEWTVLRQLMYYRLKHSLPNHMLAKVDRMSMASSLEVRAPMLDADLAELSMRLPDRHLIQHKTGKFILRKAMETHLPAAVFNHPKTGFDIPMHRFQNDQYKDVARDLLEDREGIMQLFDPCAVKAIMGAGFEQQTNRADRSLYRVNQQVWMLMQLAAWARRFHVSL